MDLGRKALGFTQKQLANSLKSSGVECDIIDISRIENGLIERYLYIANKAVEIVDRVNSQADSVKPFKPYCKPSKSFYEASIINRLLDGERHTKAELMSMLNLSERDVEIEIGKLRNDYPIFQSPDKKKKGYLLGKADKKYLPELNRLLREISNKKKIFSRQERPLIALKYEIEKDGKGGE